MPDIHYIVSTVTYIILLIVLALPMSQNRPLASTLSNVVMWVTFWFVALLGHVALLVVDTRRGQDVEKRKRAREGVLLF
jgi:hypothetical protein